VNELIPPFDFQQHVIDVWKYSPFGQDGWGWRALMGFLVIAACGLVGNFLILRRMSLIGDAISHSALLGIVVVFMITHTLGGPAMMLGALVAGLVTVGLIELIHKTSRVKQDAAIGIAFTSLFALGVVLIHTQISDAHLDADCVLYGDFMHVGRHFSNVQLPDTIADSLRSAGLIDEAILSGNNLSLPPAEICQMALVAMLVAALLLIFYKELLVSSFDPALALSLGINATALHIALMSILSIVVVSAFDAVGAILVIAMLILPGATGHLLSQRLPVILWITIAFALLSSVLGLHMAIWMDCNIAAAMVVAGAVLFIIAWILSPHDGPIAKLRARRASLEKTPEAMEAEIAG
tara:strand:+ start:11305 stop:12360 length:1056 start_codon:yes stop_codon:yes gene_type:complete